MTTFIHQPNTTALPTVHVISDSTGLTARALAVAAAAQFGVVEPAIETLSQVKCWSEVESFLNEHTQEHALSKGDGRLLVLYTLVDRDLANRMAEYAKSHPDVFAIDVMMPLVNAFQELSGIPAQGVSGARHETNDAYYRRIAAQEFTLEHDDGRNPQDLTQADIVLVGVSRASKTPLSVYLSSLGYKVANVPVDPQTQPPRELFDVDPRRIFGLLTTAEVLTDIRERRLGEAQLAAARYADYEYVCQDLDSAKALMRKLGCIMIRTNGKAVEETAQEIVSYYLRFFPRG